MRGAIRHMGALLLAAMLAVFPMAGGQASEVRTGLELESKALGGPLTYSLYLPDAYAEEPARRFPVVYLLHGYGANDREWIELGRVAEALDALIAAGDIPPVIAVMPFAGKSWYVDSAALGGPGNYETAIQRDLPEHAEVRYRAIPERGGRVVAGLSMGGYGALRLAFFHPERFSAVASLSGALYETTGIPGVNKPVADAAQEAEHWYRGAFGRPFDPALYADRNPFSRVASLSRMEVPPEILILSGDDDFFKFYEGSAALFAELRRNGIPAELRIHDGGHDWALWRAQFPEAMRFLTGALDAPEGGR
ncbi:MAG: alpha/beta hydrolase [Rhodomicrobiaceae bacterium]